MLDPSLPLAFRLANVFATTIEDLFTPSDDDLGRSAENRAPIDLPPPGGVATAPGDEIERYGGGCDDPGVPVDPRGVRSGLVLAVVPHQGSRRAGSAKSSSPRRKRRAMSTTRDSSRRVGVWAARKRANAASVSRPSSDSSGQA